MNRVEQMSSLEDGQPILKKNSCFFWKVPVAIVSDDVMVTSSF